MCAFCRQALPLCTGTGDTLGRTGSFMPHPRTINLSSPLPLPNRQHGGQVPSACNAVQCMESGPPSPAPKPARRTCRTSPYMAWNLASSRACFSACRRESVVCTHSQACVRGDGTLMGCLRASVSPAVLRCILGHMSHVIYIGRCTDAPRCPCQPCQPQRGQMGCAAALCRGSPRVTPAARQGLGRRTKAERVMA